MGVNRRKQVRRALPSRVPHVRGGEPDSLESELLTAESKHMAADSLVSAGVLIGLAGVALGFGEADAVVSLAIAGVVAWAAWGIRASG